MKKIQMVDLKSQYKNMKRSIDSAMAEVLDSSGFINGVEVKNFASSLAKELKVNHVIPCANGTDALQIAMMALGLKIGDEVIVPAFTYAATVEVIALLQLTPVFVDVNKDDFTISIQAIKNAIGPKTKAIVPVHLYGQCADMEAIMEIAGKNDLFVIEDTAQAIGATYTFKNGTKKAAGCIGHIGTTSFFPSKNLGCYGDGGALLINDGSLAKTAKMICNHGQSKKYYHTIIGVNSRLDSLQAAVLNEKLPFLDDFGKKRHYFAQLYKKNLQGIEDIELPIEKPYSTHVYHQFTITCKKRDELKTYLDSNEIPSMIYYPVPLHKQEAYAQYVDADQKFPVSEQLAESVLSLPVCPEKTTEQIVYICNKIKEFFKD